jgi:hypothetical protein
MWTVTDIQEITMLFENLKSSTLVAILNLTKIKIVLHLMKSPRNLLDKEVQLNCTGIWYEQEGWMMPCSMSVQVIE